MAIRELTIEKVQEQIGQDTGNDTLYKLVLYNDEVNTFEWVIESLVKICDHTHEQAEQSAWIIHTKGRYAVKHGGLDYLLPRRRALEDRGLSAVIEE
jgi:ATP-dependent Clp protease adaptor protein ClpS